MTDKDLNARVLYLETELNKLKNIVDNLKSGLQSNVNKGFYYPKEIQDLINSHAVCGPGPDNYGQNKYKFYE